MDPDCSHTCWNRTCRSAVCKSSAILTFGREKNDHHSSIVDHTKQPGLLGYTGTVHASTGARTTRVVASGPYCMTLLERLRLYAIGTI